MLTEVMEHFGLAKGLRQAGFFETDDHQRLLKDLRTAIYDGDLIVFSGIVGSGKTTLLWRLQEVLRQDAKVHITESLAFDVPRVSLVTLKGVVSPNPIKFRQPKSSSAKMGIRHLSTLDHIANNDQEQCYLACSYWAIQIGPIASTIGLSRFPVSHDATRVTLRRRCKLMSRAGH